MAIAMILIPVGDAIAKHLSTVSNYSAGFLAWSRFAIGSLLVAPFVLRHPSNRAEFKPAFLKQQFIRAFLISSTIVMIVKAVGLSSLSDAFGAFFIGPILAVIMAVLLLKEQASRLEWISVFLGFAGVLLVVQPSGQMSAGIPWALAAGVCYGGFLVATRWSAGNGSSQSQLAAQLMIGAIILAPLALNDLYDLGINHALTLLLMGLASVSANYLLIIALGIAGAAWLAPVIYLQVVTATVIGIFWFGDIPNALSGAGLGLIVLTGLLRVPWAEIGNKKSHNQSG